MDGSSAWDPLFALILGSCIVLPLLGLLSFYLPKALILPSSFVTLVGETALLPPSPSPSPPPPTTPRPRWRAPTPRAAFVQP